MEESTPSIARSLAELMADEFEWSGTSAKRIEATGERPQDGRIIRRQPEESGPYFRPLGIAVTCGKQSGKGRLIHVNTA